MKILFFAACIAAVLYCTLFGVYCVINRRDGEAVSLFALGALAVFATVALWILA